MARPGRRTTGIHSFLPASSPDTLSTSCAQREGLPQVVTSPSRDTAHYQYERAMLDAERITPAAGDERVFVERRAILYRHGLAPAAYDDGALHEES